jgi:hemoglobin
VKDDWKHTLGHRALALALASLALLLGACSTSAQPHATLYQRLGGEAGVKDIVGGLVDRSATDPRTQRSFDGVKLATLKDSIAQQICAISGGGCRYEGETMANSHRDARITAAEFDSMVTLLREELDRQQVEPGAKNELLRLLAPMKRDIVSHAGASARAQ